MSCGRVVTIGRIKMGGMLQGRSFGTCLGRRRRHKEATGRGRVVAVLRTYAGQESRLLLLVLTRAKCEVKRLLKMGCIGSVSCEGRVVEMYFQRSGRGRTETGGTRCEDTGVDGSAFRFLVSCLTGCQGVLRRRSCLFIGVVNRGVKGPLEISDMCSVLSQVRGGAKIGVAPRVLHRCFTGVQGRTK